MSTDSSANVCFNVKSLLCVFHKWNQHFQFQTGSFAHFRSNIILRTTLHRVYVYVYNCKVSINVYSANCWQHYIFAIVVYIHMPGRSRCLLITALWSNAKMHLQLHLVLESNTIVLMTFVSAFCLTGFNVKKKSN